MSRSYRHQPIYRLPLRNHNGTAKRQCNRKWRRAVRQAIQAGYDVLPERDELMTTWEFPSDDKTWAIFGTHYHGKMK